MPADLNGILLWPNPVRIVYLLDDHPQNTLLNVIKEGDILFQTSWTGTLCFRRKYSLVLYSTRAFDRDAR